MSDTLNDQIQNCALPIRQSDRSAFDRAFRLLYGPLVRFAMQYTKEKASACDIVQDSFVALWQNRTSIDPDQPFRAYIYRIVRNRSLNWMKLQANNTQPLDETLSGNLGEVTVSRNNGELAAHFRKWISELPDRQREAFELSRFEGLDHEEIADVMDVSPKTVNNHIVAALQKLRQHYDEHQQSLTQR